MTVAPIRLRRASIAVIGPTGSGKSTTVQLLVRALETRGLTVAVVKLAEPLYRLQREFYLAAGREIDADAQDQVLLETIATHLRRISPRALVDDFLDRLAGCDADVVLNDDLRDPHVDWPVLRDAGFRVIRVFAPEPTRLQRLSARDDLAAVPDSRTTAELDAIAPDRTLRNDGPLAALDAAVRACATELVR